MSSGTVICVGLGVGVGACEADGDGAGPITCAGRTRARIRPMTTMPPAPPARSTIAWDREFGLALNPMPRMLSPVLDPLPRGGLEPLPD